MENQAIQLVVDLCRATKVKSHIVHLSSGEGVPIIKKAKEEGLPLSVETCFHYLFFDAEDIPAAQPKFKCCPPIREHSNREQLWQALEDGVIDIVVSDHSPCTADLKSKSDGDYLASWGGISSLQFGLSILHTEAIVRRKFSYRQLVSWLCEGPSALLGLAHQKGKIEVGYDADIVIFNPSKSFTVRTGDIQFKNKLSAYEGQELVGIVEKTMLRGNVIYENGHVIEDSGPQGHLILMNDTSNSNSKL